MVQYRTCPKCNETKPTGHFNKHKRQCKECRAAIQRAYYHRNRDVVNERGKKWQRENAISRRRHLAELYGQWMTPEVYDQMLAEQGGVCAICRKDTLRGDGAKGAIDHCHVTGAVRGILCTRCNVGIAQFYDNPDLLSAAIAYLARMQNH